MAPTLFWIGLGNMGRGMVKNITEKASLDQPLMIYNRTKQRSIDLSEKLEAGKTVVVDSISEGVSKADIVFFNLANDKVVEATVAEVLKSDVTGKLFIDCSTVHPETSDKVGKIFTDAGAEFVVVPVFGAPATADAGGLVAVMAGPKASVDKAKPYFKGVTARVEIDMSDKPYGKALTLKVIGNTFVFAMVEQLAEGLVLAETTGLGTDYLHQWIESMFPGPFAAYSTRMISGDYYKRDYPLFAVDLARKDAGHALSLAKSTGARLHTTEIGDMHLQKVKEHCGPMGDVAGIYGAVRMEAGLKYENGE
ncbi:NAD binding domain of 6-phosphogluconate dehydrogenase-domain-containing protein [Podospora didyma]|uniref:NAD binding domain of 6-phosphogluconate dehydrogenase-domain-containing protein n=1 Tax=Podospora didyma TaxID=330526 RepID=A0AAE0P049_9PEZI|nr:NAD binding domain of 6-phosphogluconate dehydrogenase-domain-containing protein [Podospora didyma]